MHKVKLFGKIQGISRIGDVLRQYMFPWLAFYATPGTPADRVLFITIATLVQGIPSLCLSNFAAPFIRSVSPLRAGILANAGLGLVSLITAGAVLGGFSPQWFVLLMWICAGVFEVVYYPARDCLYADLSDGDHGAREAANRGAVAVYYGGRLVFSVVMVGVVYLLGPVTQEMPRSAIATALLIDAATFGLVVAFLATVRGTPSIPEASDDESKGGNMFAEVIKVPGAVPLIICVLAIWSFAYSSFFFNFAMYKEISGIEEHERQVSFYLVQIACAVGGLVGGRVWKVTFPNLVGGLIAVCVSEAMFAFVPTTPLAGTLWLMCNAFTSIMLFSLVFEGIVPQLIQGLQKNAEVSAAISLVKEGISPFLCVGVAALASHFDDSRAVLLAACALNALIVIGVLGMRRESLRQVIESTSPQ